MGLLSIFSKPAPPLIRLPSGSFTVDREGRILIGTLPSGFPGQLTQQIAQTVLETFRDAQNTQLSLTELVILYASFKITAREMRGGAIIYLSPQTPISSTTQP
jgi:hypothetical protein